MGGITDEFRGRTKIEAYLKYREYVDDHSDFGTAIPDPRSKKRCYSEMTQDPSTGEWVLVFHLHT
jgi:hypothetical protein